MWLPVVLACSPYLHCAGQAAKCATEGQDICAVDTPDSGNCCGEPGQVILLCATLDGIWRLGLVDLDRLKIPGALLHADHRRNVSIKPSQSP